MLEPDRAVRPVFFVGPNFSKCAERSFPGTVKAFKLAKVVPLRHVWLQTAAGMRQNQGFL